MRTAIGQPKGETRSSRTSDPETMPISINRERLAPSPSMAVTNPVCPILSWSSVKSMFPTLLLVGYPNRRREYRDEGLFGVAVPSVSTVEFSVMALIGKILAVAVFLAFVLLALAIVVGMLKSPSKVTKILAIPVILISILFLDFVYFILAAMVFGFAP